MFTGTLGLAAAVACFVVPRRRGLSRQRDRHRPLRDVGERVGMVNV